MIESAGKKIALSLELQGVDTIFCVPGEEFGFVGALAVFGLFAVLLFHGVKLASTAKNKFGSLVAIGVTALFTFHVLVNIGMTMGLMPVIGIPLGLAIHAGCYWLNKRDPYFFDALKRHIRQRPYWDA